MADREIRNRDVEDMMRDAMKSSLHDADCEALRHDPVIARVRDTLAPLPAADPAAIARVLTAVHGRRRSRWERFLNSLSDRFMWVRVPSLSLAGAGTLAVATLLLGYAGRDLLDGDDAGSPDVVASVDGAPNSGAAPAGTDSFTGRSGMVAATTVASVTEETALPVQFVLTEAGARSVSLVGAFNDWDMSATALERVPGSDLWTVTVNLKPGRHVYAFVLDGNRWVRDPRAPEAADADFGRPQSVVIVQVPWATGGDR